MRKIQMVANGRLANAYGYRNEDNDFLVSVREVAQALKATVEWQGPTKQAIIRRGTQELIISADGAKVKIGDRTEVWPGLVRLVQDKLFVAPGHLARWLGAQYAVDAQGLIWFMQAEKALQGKKIVLDPGHGGKDTGFVNNQGLQEKKITFAITSNLVALLSAGGALVVQTRTGDEEVLLEQRFAMANQHEANLFLSVHTNSFRRPEVNGIETYYYQNWPSQRAACLLQTELVSELGLANRGVREANFLVLRQTQMPAVLTEVGFLSNLQEAKLLADPLFQTRTALALYRGCCLFFS